ncbi:hypothetical protein [Pedobacter metabolipauper]|uniref:Uncharacterized protein n=1 Tax=Pedobacter metabolipauper TaxID=425513 RepID=A0A4R6T220_9SPHI|nr:hypothetical protein [Pedobacter metabolipauper]TDQ11371.1 hypothetical protein ATK78_0489 [Pedobacter metabolipauper]
MSTVNIIPEYTDYKAFYEQAVLPLKEKNPEYIRLDGKLKGSTRNVSAYFWYKEKKWKVDADTYIDRLKLAYESVNTNEEPFIIKNRRDGKSQELTIAGQPVRDNKFYVYLASPIK